MRWSLLASSMLACLSAGCGSVFNHTNFMGSLPKEEVYGGVQADATIAKELAGNVVHGKVKTPIELAAAVFFSTMCVLDMPFSLVADTLWLPHDILVTREKEILASNPELAPMPHSTDK